MKSNRRIENKKTFKVLIGSVIENNTVNIF